MPPSWRWASGVGSTVCCGVHERNRVVNLAPAVVEAAYSGLLLLIDHGRPPTELRGSGAQNQTIDQVGFFGQQVRTAVDLFALGQDADPESTWRKVTDRVVRRRAIGIGHPGPAPVQLNVGLREPLVPDPGVDQIPIDSGETSELQAPGCARTDQPLPSATLGLLRSQRVVSFSRGMFRILRSRSRRWNWQMRVAGRSSASPAAMR